MRRRDVLRCSAACAAAAACGKFVDSPVAIEAGAPSRNILSVPMARVPELAQQGGSVILHVDAHDCVGRRVSLLVANTSSQGLRAWDAYCPHAGCEVAWVDGEDSVVCPCHFSRFSNDGRVTHGPAAGDLDSFDAKVTNDALLIDLSTLAPIFPPPVNGLVTFAIAQAPALAQVGGSVTSCPPGSYPIVVLRSSAAEVIAFDARCTHLGCAVRGASKLFICPCHGSLFDLAGNVTKDPATAPLKKLAVTFDGATVRVRV